MSSCPTRKQLHRWLAGELSDAESQVVAAHVKNCTQVCQPLIDSFWGFEDDATAARTPSAQARPKAALPALPAYEILGPLGRGGMGVVYKARHRHMDRIVAIKVLPPGVMQDAAAVARFEREVRAAARLQHAHIVAAYDAAEAEGVHFLVMEYVDGTDLAALVRRDGPLTVEQAVDCVLQAARGLAYAHRHGVVHRDIKPSNLLLDREGMVKVLDMGLARFESPLAGDAMDLTSLGQIMGTVDYMAPEQALDTHHADARCDIYSLGMTLWYLVTGRPAYSGTNALARLLAHREQPLPSLRAACPAVPPELEAVFRKMVAKQPGDRYQTMAEVIAAWDSCRGALARDESLSGTALHIPSAQDPPDSRVGTAHHESRGGQGPPFVAVQTTPAQTTDAPDTEATLALGAAQLDTDPNTEQSLAISASALRREPSNRGRRLVVAAALVGLAAVAAAAVVIRIQSGEGEVVKPDVTAVVADDRDRAAAEWVIERGGTVGCLTPQDDRITAKTVSELPPDPFQVFRISLEGIANLSNADLARFEALERLEELNLAHTNVDGQAMAQLARLSGLVFLQLQRSRVKSSDLVALAALRRLAVVALDAETQVDDDWAALPALRSVRQLSLTGNATADAIRHLGKATQVRLIWLWEANAEAAEVAAPDFKRANPHCRLVISSKPPRTITGDPETELTISLHNLGAELELYLLGDEADAPVEVNEVGDRPVRVAAITLPPGVTLDDDRVRDLDCLCDLYSFRAAQLRDADRYAVALAGQTLLYEVKLDGSDLTDAGLASLAKLPRLGSLDVQGTQVTQAGIDALRKALPDCKIVWEPGISTVPVEDRDRAAAQWVLAQQGVATCLAPSGAVTVASSPAALPTEKFQLYGAGLSGVNAIVAADLDRFAHLPRLCFLELDNTHLDSAAIARLVKIPHLGTLDVSDTLIKSSELGGLARARKLWWLTLSAPQNDDAFAGIAKLSSLRQLTIYRATADDLRQLANAKQLRTAWLPDADTADEQAVAQLRAAQPLCRVLVGARGHIRPIGLDPIGEAARRLCTKGAELEIVGFPPEGAPQPVTDDAAIAPGKAFSIASITLPAGVSLDDDEIGWLGCLDHALYFCAEESVGADRFAAALADQLLSGVRLANSDLTDAGLERFQASPSLEYLDARDTKVTRAGIEALRTALRDCEIVWDPPAATTPAL